MDGLLKGDIHIPKGDPVVAELDVGNGFAIVDLQRLGDDGVDPVAGALDGCAPHKGTPGSDTGAGGRGAGGIRFPHGDPVEGNAHHVRGHHALAGAQALAQIHQADVHMDAAVLLHLDEGAGIVKAIAVRAYAGPPHGDRNAYAPADPPVGVLVFLRILFIFPVKIQSLCRLFHDGADADLVKIQLVAAGAHVPVAQQVFSPQRRGGHAQLGGQLIHGIFQGEDGLGGAKAPHGAGMGVVGEHGHRIIIHVIYLIRPGPQGGGLIHDRRGHVDVTARVPQSLHVHGHQGAVGFGPQGHVEIDGMALVAFLDGFLPGQGVLGRPAGFQGHQARPYRQGFGAFDLAAKGAAHNAGLHRDPGHGQVQHPVQGDAQVIRSLDGPQHRHLRPHPAGDHGDGFRLDIGVLHKAGAIMAAYHHVCGFHGSFGIPFDHMDAAANVGGIIGIDDLLVVDGLFWSA